MSPAGGAAPDALQRLEATLDHCARRVPLYRGITPPAGADDVLPALARFPILGRARLLRAFPRELVPEGASLPAALESGEVSFVGTSGTGGDRVQVLWHQPWWDAQERDGYAPSARARGAVAEPGYREAVLTTPMCSGNLCHVGDRPMEERILDARVLFLNQKLDPALWSDRDCLRMADELDRFAPDVIEADPAYLAHFAVRLARLGRAPHRPRFVELSYEYPSRRHVAAIARVFEAPVLDAYGSTECGFMLMECDAGGYHPNPRWSHLELAPVASAQRPDLARVLATPLANRWLNLVRFDTGDLVRRRATPCPCGRGDDLEVASIEGRARDALITPGGRPITVREVDLALAPVEGLLHYRAVQTGDAQVELELVADGLGALDVADAGARLAEVLGVAPRARVVASIPVEPSGKYRLCKATHRELDALLGAIA